MLRCNKGFQQNPGCICTPVGRFNCIRNQVDKYLLGLNTVDTNWRQVTFNGPVNVDFAFIGAFMDETSGLSNDVQNTLVTLLVWFVLKKSANVLHGLIS